MAGNDRNTRRNKNNIASTRKRIDESARNQGIGVQKSKRGGSKPEKRNIAGIENTKGTRRDKNKLNTSRNTSKGNIKKLEKDVGTKTLVINNRTRIDSLRRDFNKDKDKKQKASKKGNRNIRQQLNKVELEQKKEKVPVSKTERENVQRIVNMIKNGELPEESSHGTDNNSNIKNRNVKNRNIKIRKNLNDAKMALKKQAHRLNRKAKFKRVTPDREQIQGVRLNGSEEEGSLPIGGSIGDLNATPNKNLSQSEPNLNNDQENKKSPNSGIGADENLEIGNLFPENKNGKNQQQGQQVENQQKNNNRNQATSPLGAGTAAASWLGANSGNNAVNNTAIERQKNEQNMQSMQSGVKNAANRAVPGAKPTKNVGRTKGRTPFSVANFRHANILARIGFLGSTFAIIIFILMTIGALSFIMNMPGMVITNLKEWLDDTCSTMVGYLIGKEQATKVQIEQLATDMYNSRNRLRILGICF